VRILLALSLFVVIGCAPETNEPVERRTLAAVPLTLHYPLDEFHVGVTCDWDCYTNPNGSPHAALDLSTGSGKQLVRAATHGWLTVHGISGGCGNMATITHPSGYVVKYCHFSSYEGISRNVRRGDVIGRSGSTGYTDPPGYDHVHLQILDPDGAAVHPGCPPGISDACNDATSNTLWAMKGDRVARAVEVRLGFDFDGNGCEDLVARTPGQALLLYGGDCAGSFASEQVAVGSSFGDFDVLLAASDWNGDGAADIIGRRLSDASLRLYAGDGHGAYLEENQLIGSSFSGFDKLLFASDWDGDGCADLVGRRTSDATLRLYAGNCAGGYTKEDSVIGTSFDDFDTLLLMPDFDADGCADLMGRRSSDQSLRLYAGDCHGGYRSENQLVGTSFGDFDLLLTKDWNGDGCSDLLGRRSSDGTLRLYAASCTGGWASQNQLIGEGWAAMTAIF